jgi:hypothetical protein
MNQYAHNVINCLISLISAKCGRSGTDDFLLHILRMRAPGLRIVRETHIFGRVRNSGKTNLACRRGPIAVEGMGLLNRFRQIHFVVRRTTIQTSCLLLKFLKILAHIGSVRIFGHENRSDKSARGLKIAQKNRMNF